MTDHNPSDRSAWLERYPDDIKYLIGSQVAPADYWNEIEGTAGWAVFRLSRRVDELFEALRRSS
ncbi:hypothetical protein [Pseudactinotalea sp.]|uniref:hypothetical protein n=1 Tax=Pseudactinotalea sp. TaxID=1926260 RepID=UPI003B3B022E